MKLLWKKTAVGGVEIAPCQSRRHTLRPLGGLLPDCNNVRGCFKSPKSQNSFLLFVRQVALLLDMVRRQPANRLIPTLIYSVPRIALQLTVEARMGLANCRGCDETCADEL